MTMDVSYIARNLRLPESFRDHVVERTERLQPLAEGADTLEVRVTKSSHHKHSDETVRVELTVRGPRDVVRAEADADDKLVAFDQAATRLAERLRRMRDRRKDRRHGKLGASAARARSDSCRRCRRRVPRWPRRRPPSRTPPRWAPRCASVRRRSPRPP